ncbi:quinol oxidase (plasmid) [Halostagnicola larsenii XH-48]|uniref:Quinol oxidase n=1 Tax=Halostagnicola larsenii XH-48 TaxID=797299 RepID=W0JS84_9EURY|nr:quinol oxidase [Halostagnicola larsenii XH-48]
MLAIRNLTNLDGRIAYADAKGVPNAETLVPASSGLLLGGGIGIGLWKLPRISAGSIAAFFIGVTPLMHDFWAVDEESRGEELTSFLQNLTLLGAAIAFFARANATNDSPLPSRNVRRCCDCVTDFGSHR